MRSLGLAEGALRAALAASGYTSRDVSTRGARVRIVEGRGGGKLPTVVFLHGLGSRGADYLPLLRRIRPHVRRVVAPDLPGHGASEVPAPFEIDACVGALVEALDATLDEPAIVFGNSLGGFSAIRFALERPSLARRLFLASPAGAPSSPEELDRTLALLRIDSHRHALNFLDTVLHREPGPFRHVVAWGLRRRFSAVRALIDRVAHAPSFTPDELARLSMPVHLVWGRSERLLPRSHLAFFRAHLRGATVEEPHGFGHSPQLDDVSRVARRLIAFASG